ncbi:glycosyltransferase [Erythrobacter sp. YT30]|uniref:glycosyltransferase n=1 Tax=Erythrobacter sp. YT30 TaxID=1735012 RepID=UPI0009EBC425|nr:glycosyltransferase [Erythrobacter sp. YT30]
MILVTVGMQLGFDRLIEALDHIASTLEHEVIAQSGNGKYVAQNMEQHSSIVPHEFEGLISSADLIVSHAGIGSVLTAARHGIPIVLFPRRADMGEHRNDNQLATCRQLQGRPGIHMAFDEAELRKTITFALSNELVQNAPPKGETGLQYAVRKFGESGRL